MLSEALIQNLFCAFYLCIVFVYALRVYKMVGEYAIRCQVQIEFRTPKLNTTEVLSEALIQALFRIVLRFIMTVLHFQRQIDRYVI